MLQKGDRAAASHELDLLIHNFPDQQDFINKAHKPIPGASTLLAPTACVLEEPRLALPVENEVAVFNSLLRQRNIQNVVAG
jgi:hypothetical protein